MERGLGAGRNRFSLPGSSRQRCVRAGRSARRRRSVLRTDSPAMLALMARRRTCCVRCANSAHTAATSQKYAARCARGHESCASRRLRRAPQPTRTHLWARPAHCESRHAEVVLSRQVVSGGATSGATGSHRAGVGARSAQRTSNSPQLSERNERSECSEFCGATPDRAAQWSRRAAPTATVGAPQGTACGDPRRAGQQATRRSARS
jgi:hypothetical protein